MKSKDRARLASTLRDHVGKIAADLREKMRAPGDIRVRAKQLHADEQVAEDFDVWTDLLSRRAAVLWVLKAVYVRVLEDRGLIKPGRLLDQEAQQLFERLAPHLGETAFLCWVYRDLASSQGGLPELFSPQPAEVALPSDELSRALIAFWRHRDADTGATWSFAEERFEGELMGDLYQELDPVVKDTFALCQTPDFVRAFILDRTLTPAINTFGAEEVRLLDPACGSGHFLIDGLKRLVAATVAKHPDWERWKVVAHALDRVVGIDLNDYACALARARLIMTAAELAGVTSLSDAARFHPHVYWADGLEQVERDELKPSLQFSLFEKVEEKPRATLTRTDVRVALKKIFQAKFHAVVANPPYIVEGDDARKDYQRQKIGRSQRYVSAYRQYSLSSPFTERCFQLALTDANVGIITSNNFMKREFGKPLIEKVLAGVDLTLVVDTSQAHIPFHETPTVLLFARNRRPTSKEVPVVMGMRGQSGTPEDPAKGLVWSSIEVGCDKLGFEDDYVSVAALPRETLNKFPWSLGGGGAAELKGVLESESEERLAAVVDEVGAVSVIRADDAYEPPEGSVRGALRSEWIIPHVLGEDVRDWTVAPTTGVIHPYLPSGDAAPESPSVWRARLWPFKALLGRRVAFGKTQIERGLQWFEYSMLFKERFLSPLLLVFANVASHNHVGLLRERMVVNSKAPVIKLPSGAPEADYLALLGLLNSSVACFWMKQVFFPKGSATHDVSKEGLRPENNGFEFAATGMLKFPLPRGWQNSRLVELARSLDRLGVERSGHAPVAVVARPENLASASRLRSALSMANEQDNSALGSMVHCQEELDWLCYALYGLVPYDLARPSAETRIGADQRPFNGGKQADASMLPSDVRELYAERVAALRNIAALRLIENPVYKRLWRGRQGIFGRYDRTYEAKTQTALRSWLADQVEIAAKDRGRTFKLEQLVASLQADPRVLAACEVLTGRRDFNLSQLVRETLASSALPNHRFHLFKPSGLVKRSAWEQTWDEQRREEAGEKVLPSVPPIYASSDFAKPEYWQLRGKLDVPKERFIAFTEVPGRSGVETLYGWAGWSPVQRLKALLGIDEELEDAGVSVADRIGLLDSAWRVLPDVTHEDAPAAARLKAELQALVGPEGPSRELIEDWRMRFPAPSTRAGRVTSAAPTRGEDESGDEESDES